MKDQNSDLTREEQEAFRSLADKHHYSKGEEDRIVRALQRHGLVKAPPKRAWRWFGQAAAAAAVLAVTFFLGMEYGSKPETVKNSVIKPVRESSHPVQKLVVPKNHVEDSSALEDYRDEPDHPGNGTIIVVKNLE